MTVTGGVYIGANGLVELHGGTINGDLSNAGLLSLGSRSYPASGDTYTINGNFTQTASGRLVMDIGPWGNDLLTVTGQATLAGQFQATLTDGYDPWPGSSFSLLSYGSRQGTFDGYSLPPLTYYGTWDPRYDDPLLPDAFSLWVI